MKIKLTSLRALYLTQFLSALADSIIIVVIALMLRNSLHTDNAHNGTIFLVESFFLFAYVLFAPFVGTFADRNNKTKVLLTGNVIKGLGILLMFSGFNPGICYGIIGLGAAVYGPAKYGILTELTSRNDELLDANGKIESFTILAIILGTLIGGYAADISTVFGEILCLIFYGVSIFITFIIPSQKGNKNLAYADQAKHFFNDVKISFQNHKLRFTLLGSGAFWMISVVIKNALFLWIPEHLGIEKGFGQTILIGMTAVGIVIGALLSKRFTSVKHFYRSIFYGFIVALLALAFPWIAGHSFFAALLSALALLTIGVFAGMFIIPLNAALQQEGHHTLGVGKTIAIQNLFDNSMMLFGSGAVFILSFKFGVSVTGFMFVFAIVFFVLVSYLATQIKRMR